MPRPYAAAQAKLDGRTGSFDELVGAQDVHVAVFEPVLTHGIYQPQRPTGSGDGSVELNRACPVKLTA